MKVRLPDYAEKLFLPYRYKVLHGGRGSAKSESVARILLLKGVAEKRFVLCGREFQNSIAESVHKLLNEKIDEMGLNEHYTVLNDKIVGANGTEFVFKGIRQNIQSIKSMQGITDLWLEEADTVSKTSWDILVPTVRAPGSEIWVTFNPNNEDDPTYQKFLGPNGPPPNSIVIKANWRDNPWFPEVLMQEKDHQFKTNADLAMHVWEGECRSNSDAQIFKNKYSVDYFDVDTSWDGPYFGCDWGFSVDPTTLIKIYIDWVNLKIYVRNEAWGVGVDLKDIKKKLYSTVPGSENALIYADCSRPETISFMRGEGYNIKAADKWTGSVEDGIEFIKSFNQVVIHPECVKTIEEFKKYSYKVDRLTQDVTTDIVDAYNHIIDAIRYALNKIITRKISVLDVM